jgi:hypothetical protein
MKKKSGKLKTFAKVILKSASIHFIFHPLFSFWHSARSCQVGKRGFLPVKMFPLLNFYFCDEGFQFHIMFLITFRHEKPSFQYIENIISLMHK